MPELSKIIKTPDFISIFNHFESDYQNTLKFHNGTLKSFKLLKMKELQQFSLFWNTFYFGTRCYFSVLDVTFQLLILLPK